MVGHHTSEPCFFNICYYLNLFFNIPGKEVLPVKDIFCCIGYRIFFFDKYVKGKRIKSKQLDERWSLSVLYFAGSKLCL